MIDQSVRPSVPRFDTIDLLRGLSILSVVLLHIWIRCRLSNPPQRLSLPPWLEHLLLRNGDHGVTVFFAISGFLITFTSIKRFGTLAQLRPLTFYRIRFARIAPLLLLLLAILSTFAILYVAGFEINHKKASLGGALFSALTFHLNWYLPANWDVLWSLSVEEMFYVFFPLICFLILRWRKGFYLFLVLLVAFVVMGPLSRAIWTAYNGIWQEKSYLGGMDAIALGCLTALLTNKRMTGRKPGPKTLIAIQALGGLLIFWIALWPTYWQWLHPFLRFLGLHALDDTVLAFGTCLVMFASILRGAAGSRFTAPIRWFGRHSYEVYMTHEFLVVWGVELLLKFKRGPLALWYFGILLLTVPLGWVVAHFYSEPMNRRLRGARPPAMNQPGLQSH